MKSETAIAGGVFMSGRSQAVRIPKAFRLDAEKVEIVKQGKDLLLKPVKKGRTLGWYAKGGGDVSGGLLRYRQAADVGGIREWSLMRKPEHFEARVREHENWRKVEEQKEKVANREK